jgi:NAD(P)-dependent dehydrogenase (short-subunit alcohol dehydrogenase family)
VTGAARGIGRSVADTLESKGVRVPRPGHQELDLTEPESVTAYLASVDETVDIMVLNAGVNNPESLRALSVDNWSSTQQVNVSSNVLLLQGLLPRMAATGYGRVVAVSTVYAHRARTGRVAYSASKAAIEEVVRSVAVEYAGQAHPSRPAGRT